MLLGELIFDTLLGVPLSIAVQTLERLREDVDSERLVTEAAIKKKLQELQLNLQDGELDEAEYNELEAALIERLRAVAAARREVADAA